MAKSLFSFHLDDDLKSAATNRAIKENRSLANLVETSIRFYLNPEPVGARVTVRTISEEQERDPKVRKLKKLNPEIGKFTARIKSIDTDTEDLFLVDRDPMTGRNQFKIKDIISVHLM